MRRRSTIALAFIAIAGGVALLILGACAAPYSASSLPEADAPGAEAGADVGIPDAPDPRADPGDAKPMASFCAQFDGSAHCADFDESVDPFGAFSPIVTGPKSTAIVAPASANHASPSLATSALSASTASQENEAVAAVDNVSQGGNGIHIETDFFVSTPSAHGTIVQIYGNDPKGSLSFAAYLELDEKLTLQIFDASSTQIGAPLAMGSIGASWAHIEIDLIGLTGAAGATSGTTVNAIITMDGAAGAKVSTAITQEYSSISVRFGSYPDASVPDGAFSVNVDNVLVRPL